MMWPFLKSDDSRSSEQSEAREDGTRSSSHDEALERLGDKILDRAISGYCYEHEISYQSLASGKSDFVEITPHLTGLTACTVHSGLAASEPVVFGEWTAKKIQSSIESAWQVILAAEPGHIIIHPVIPDQWQRKAKRAFWHFCAEVCRWQDDRGHFVTIMYPAHSGFWLSQCCRSLKWRNSMTFATFKNKGEHQYGEVSFLTNLPEGSLDRLESLEEGYDSEKTFDPRFAVLLSQCLVGDGRSDQRQAHLFEDIFEDFDDGTLCALCVRSERNSEALSALPSFVLERFVMSSLVQTLTYIDDFLPYDHVSTCCRSAAHDQRSQCPYASVPGV